LLNRNLARLLLPLVDEIYCVSEDDRSEILHLMPKAKVFSAGDTRYDQVLHRLSQRKPLNDHLRPQYPTKTLVAGSTWPEDEKVLLPAMAPFLREQRLNLILAPHEPTKEHLNALRSQLKSLDLPYSLYSDGQSNPAGHVLIIDQVGLLADLYSWGRLAFVGGSFRGSVHSVMEPLGSGAVTLVGPYHENNREALEFKHKELNHNLHMVQSCRDQKEIEEALAAAENDGDGISTWSQLIIAQVHKKSGASHAFVTAFITKTQLAPD
ncbi:MAG: hypothetical protein KDD43_13765, partial [Bdellovibrionales bacterium]|nr:hypothetical protein [Bdellovibrionales bacterium]